jgi:hypothetical protein
MNKKVTGLIGIIIVAVIMVIAVYVILTLCKMLLTPSRLASP